MQLAESSPYSSFFLSADWTAAWLEIFGDLLQPEILVFEARGEAVGACLLVERTERRGPFRVRRVYLNTGGEDPTERSSMEFNNILCRSGWEQGVAAALGAQLRALKWDEFAAPGFCPGQVLRWLETEALPGLASSTSLLPSFYVDLARLRQSNTPYESTLSLNTRQQLRRSLKLYGRQGTLRTEVARDLPSAQAMFEGMIELHQRTWSARGEPGAFGSGRKVAFHRALILRAFSRGAIQMLRVTAGQKTVGVLYNFVQNGKVYYYQCGLNYSQDKHLKPGLVTHTCAIRYCLEQGLDDYDFLAGDARYKRSLAKDSRPLAWVVFSRPHLKLAVIEFLRVVKRKVENTARKQAD
jgi:hypothetical protein